MYDDLALRDATALFRFLARRGYISPAADSALMVQETPPLLREASPLVGVDMIKASRAGVVVSANNRHNMLCMCCPHVCA